MTYSRFDVVVVPFPFTDRQSTKRRPALVLSGKAFNDSHNQVVLGMITSSTDNPWRSDVRLAQWAEAGLAVSCRFRFKLFTLGQDLVLKRTGNLGVKDIKAVDAALRENLGTG